MNALGSLLKIIICISICHIACGLKAQTNTPLSGSVYTDSAPLAIKSRSDNFLQRLRQEPGYKAKEEKMNREILMAQRPFAGDTLVLPVVFHIISLNPFAVPDQVIINALQDLNDAFGKTGSYAGSKGVDTKIRFCLAQKDPDGGSSSGITRTQSFFSTHLNPSIEDDRLKNLVRWDPSKYINIWFVSSINEETSAFFYCGNWYRHGEGGYATLPLAANTTDGIVVTRFQLLLAHEMGHYLGLYHTFEGACQNNNCATDGDKVCDTPPDAALYPAPSCSSPTNSCSTDTLSGFTIDVPDQIANFMDYENPACTNEFTQGQADRMRAAITTQRPGLLELQCQKPCDEAIKAEFTRNVANPKTGEPIHFTNSSRGAATYQWLVNDVIVSTSANFTISFPQAGKNKVTLKAYNATSCFASYTDYIIVNCGVTARFYSDVRTIASKTPIYTDSIDFTNTSENANSFKWIMSNNTGMSETIVSTAKDLHFVFPTPGKYSIRLAASNGSCIDTTGTYFVEVADPTPDGVISITAAHCYQKNKVQVTFQICNFGYATLAAGIPISFYDADPRGNNAHKIGGSFYTPNSIRGQCCAPLNTYLLDIPVDNLEELYVVFNDGGNGTPVTLPNTSFVEKSYINNFSSISNFKFTVVTVPTEATLEPGDTIQLSAYGRPGNVSNYLWSSPKNLSCTTCQTTALIADSSTTKQIIAESEFGCFDTAFVDIKVPPADDYTIKINAIECAAHDSLYVNFTISNSFKRGVIPKGLMVSFYNANPMVTTATLIQPLFRVADTVKLKEYSFSAYIKSAEAGTIYAAVNDTGTTFPLQLPNTVFLEKEYSNNIASFSYAPEKVVLQPADTTVVRKTAFPVKILSTIYDASSTRWFPAPGYSLSCLNCNSPSVTVSDNSVIIMETENKYGCLIKGAANVKILPPDMTVKIVDSRCYTNNSTIVTFKVCMNNSYDTVFSNLPVSFYDTTPSSSSANLLLPVYYTPSIKPGNCNTYTHVINTPSTSHVYAVVNDKGNNSAAIPSIEFEETNYLNNFADTVITPFRVNIKPTDTTINRLENVVLTSSVSGGPARSYVWKPSQFLSCFNCSSVIVRPPHTVSYQLVALNENSCTDTASAVVRTITSGIVNLPNAFTPNGDGLNDIFYILAGSDVSMVKDFEIYSRWGEKVFQVGNVPANDPQHGWNGTVKGTPAPTGTYVYMVTVALPGGTQQFFKGTIVLIR